MSKKLITKNTPKISIIVPVYNVEQYIQKCILSIIEQIFTDYEAIIINDGSLDNSIKVITPLIKNDRRFSIINQENQGAGGARNTGIKKAKGEYVCFVDSDDYIEDDYLYLLYTTITKHNADICTSDINIIYDHGGAPSRQNLGAKNWQEAVKKILMCTDGGGMCHRMYKRYLFKNIRLTGFFCEDKLTMVDILLTNKVSFIPFIDKPLYNYAIRGNSTTRTANKTHIDDIFDMLKSVKALLIKHNNNNELINYYPNFYICMNAFIFSMLKDFSKNFNENTKYLVKKTDHSIVNWKNIRKMLKLDEWQFYHNNLIFCACIHTKLVGLIAYKLLQKYRKIRPRSTTKKYVKK